MSRRTTVCRNCQGVVDLVLDQVLELEVLRYLECRHCRLKLVRMKQPHELAQPARRAA
jgi:hypothetical protein